MLFIVTRSLTPPACVPVHLTPTISCSTFNPAVLVAWDVVRPIELLYQKLISWAGLRRVSQATHCPTFAFSSPPLQQLWLIKVLGGSNNEVSGGMLRILTLLVGTCPWNPPLETPGEHKGRVSPLVQFFFPAEFNQAKRYLTGFQSTSLDGYLKKNTKKKQCVQRFAPSNSVNIGE